MSSGRRFWSTALVGVLAMVATACEPNRFVSGWIPYWEANDGQVAMRDPDASALFSEVSPMWFGLGGSGTIVALTGTSTLDSAVAAARQRGIPVIPSIYDSTSAGVMSGVIANATLRAQHVNAIVDLVMSKGFDGIDLDYEVWAFSQRSEWDTIKPNWITFVTSLASALHARGKVLSMTVPPVWSGGTRGYWVYAQAELAPVVDRIRLMAYDWSVGAPGPVSPMFWIDSVIAYSSSIAPPEKLQLGVPTYGRHWWSPADESAVCPDADLDGVEALRMDEIAAYRNVPGRTTVRDATGELRITWTEEVTGFSADQPTAPPGFVPVSTVPAYLVPADAAPSLADRITPPGGIVSCTVEHELYVSDAITVRMHAAAALAADWSGIVVWALGYETADMYQRLATLDAGRPNGDPIVTLDPITAPSSSPAQVAVSGASYDPEFDLPTGVRIVVTNRSSSAVVWDRTITANSSREAQADLPSGIGIHHGFARNVRLTTGPYRVCATTLGYDASDPQPTVCRNVTVP